MSNVEESNNKEGYYMSPIKEGYYMSNVEESNNDFTTFYNEEEAYMQLGGKSHPVEIPIPQAVDEILKAKSPPPPLYSAPINATAVVKSYVLDAAMYGTAITISLIAPYTIFSFCVGITLRVALPPISSHVWKGLAYTLPFFAYRVVQVIAGLAIHPAAIPFQKKEGLELHRMNIHPDFQPTRVSAKSATGHLIDAVFMKAKNGKRVKRCILVSLGNGMNYEEALSKTIMQNGKEVGVLVLAKKLNANILFYNYAGVGRSSGIFPNRDAMVASHQAMFGLLKKLNVEEIVDFGWSIGGGVKWRDHYENPRKEEKVCIIDYQTFRSTAGFGRDIAGPMGELGIKALQWNYDNETTMKNSSQPHIVVQDGIPETGVVLHDGVMPASNSLAAAAKKENVVLMDTRKAYGLKYGVRNVHCLPLDPATIEKIAAKVETHFKAE